MGTFQYDNPFMAALVKIANMMMLSFFWMITCLPIVTIIPASAALFHTTTKVVRGNGNGIVRDYFASLKGSLKQGLLLSLICMASGGLIFFAAWYGWQIQQSIFGMLYFIIGCVIVFVWAMLVFYLPVVLSRFEGGLNMYLRMALYLANKNILKTILRMLLLAVVVLLVDFYPIALLLLPGLYADLICGGMEKLLKKFMEENGLKENGEEETAADAAVEEALPEEEPRITSLEMARLYDESRQDDAAD